MGKPGEVTSSEDEEEAVPSLVPETSIVVCQKRHKKHKHKKHKRKKMSHEEDETAGTMAIAESSTNKSSRVRGKKIERPGIGLVSSSGKPSHFSSLGGPGTSLVVGATSPRVAARKKMAKGARGRESATSSEEERWLDAIESGKLEEVDEELKKIKPKDPKLMTARQRAMFERKTDTEPSPGAERLVSLPSGYKEKVMTAEAIQKAALKSLKRKQLADEKREKDKKKTMERLLKKQESRASKLVGRGRAWKRQVPFITYRSTIEGNWISLPPGRDFPIGCGAPKNANSDVPSVVEKRCSVPGCKNPKRYSCSKTNVPLCSLDCYRANLAAILT